MQLQLFERYQNESGGGGQSCSLTYTRKTELRRHYEDAMLQLEDEKHVPNKKGILKP